MSKRGRNEDGEDHGKKANMESGDADSRALAMGAIPRLRELEQEVQSLRQTLKATQEKLPTQLTEAKKRSKASHALGSLKGKTICVTGGGSGIGQDIATTLDKYGAKLVLVGRNEANLKQVQSTLSDARYVIADLAQPKECARLADELSDVDCLVNNAGVAFVSPLMEQTVDDWNSTMNINARSVFLLSQGVAKHWIANGKEGNICNLSSQASMAPLPGHTTYCASKAAVDMLTRMMAMELGPHNIRVNSVNPTVVLTEMGKKNWSDPVKAGGMLNSIPLGRFAEPAEVSEAVAWMLCDASGMINGHCLPIDGGLTSTLSHLMPKQ